MGANRKRKGDDKLEMPDLKTYPVEVEIVDERGTKRPAEGEVDYNPIPFKEAKESFEKVMEADVEIGGVLKAELTADDYDNYLEFSDEEDFGAWWFTPEVVDLYSAESEDAMWTEINWFEFFEAFTPKELQWCIDNGFFELTSVWVPTRDPQGVLKLRWCVREFKFASRRDDLFTPASTASTERVIDIVATKRRLKRVIVDCKNAYLHADEDEKVFAKPPRVWLERWIAQGGSPTVVWILRKQIYGRRKASQAFNDYLAVVFLNLGMIRYEALLQFWKHPKRKMIADVHQDDGHATGKDEDLEWFVDELKEHLMIKSSGIIGEGKSYMYLKSWRTVLRDGTVLQMNEKHIDKLMDLYGMKQDTKPAPTPLSENSWIDENALDNEAAERLRTANGVFQFIQKYRRDLQYAIKEIGKRAKSPGEKTEKQVKRIIRFLHGTRNRGDWISADGDLGDVGGDSDSNWASCLLTRRSTSSGRVTVGGSLATGFSRDQKVQSLSVGEAEFYSCVSTFIEMLSIARLLVWLEVLNVRMSIGVDSTACKGILARRGVGRIKHVELRTLWIQEFFKGRENGEKLCVRKIATLDMPADIGTKSFSQERLLHLSKLNGMIDFDRKSQSQRVEPALIQNCLGKFRKKKVKYDDDDEEDQVVGTIRRSAEIDSKLVKTIAMAVMVAMKIQEGEAEETEIPEDDDGVNSVYVAMLCVFFLFLGIFVGRLIWKEKRSMTEENSVVTSIGMSYEDCLQDRCRRYESEVQNLRRQLRNLTVREAELLIDRNKKTTRKVIQTLKVLPTSDVIHLANCKQGSSGREVRPCGNCMRGGELVLEKVVEG